MLPIEHPQLRAFFALIKWSEIGPGLLAASDDGYDVCVGSTPDAPILFTDYSRHPGDYPGGPGISRNPKMNSDAAGFAQFMGRYWPFYRDQLKLPDFGKTSQEIWCRQMIIECGALADIENGHVEAAVYKCRSRWASFPGASYGQHEQKLADLFKAFTDAGGVLV